MRAGWWKIALTIVGVLAGDAGLARADSGPRPAPGRVDAIARRSARAESFTDAERAALVGGQTVSRPMALSKGEGRYVGGVSYQLVRAAPAEVLAAFGDVRELPNMLPRTKSARLVDVTSRGARIELCQGTALVDTSYTVRLRRVGASELRFRLDESRPHGIRDLWGYLKVRAMGQGRTLVTVAVALDVGPGIMRTLFEDRIQRAILATPRHIRDYLEPRALARATPAEPPAEARGM